MRYTEAQIKEWIAQHQESGLSIEDFSKGKPFHKSTLSYWYKKSSAKIHSFIELKVPKSDKFILQILRPDGMTFNINQEFTITELKQLIQC